jgi:hypothetical protein
MVLDCSRILRECQPGDFTFSFFMTKKRIRTINGMRVLTPPEIARATRWNPDDENTGLSRQQVTNLCRAGGPPFDKRANPGGKQYLIYETPELGRWIRSTQAICKLRSASKPWQRKIAREMPLTPDQEKKVAETKALIREFKTAEGDFLKHRNEVLSHYWEFGKACEAIRKKVGFKNLADALNLPDYRIKFAITVYRDNPDFAKSGKFSDDTIRKYMWRIVPRKTEQSSLNASD